jgi:hypothetical protein
VAQGSILNDSGIDPLSGKSTFAARITPNLSEPISGGVSTRRRVISELPGDQCSKTVLALRC